MEVGKIVEAIRLAEKKTSAEICIHLSERRIELNPLKRAKKLFYRRQLRKTRLRNGVLIYLNLRLKRFAIYADAGIHEKFKAQWGANHWSDLATQLSASLKTSAIENSLTQLIQKLGDELSIAFPLTATDLQTPHNELPDDVTED